MNSTQLQKQFPEVYKDFFAKSDLVASGCFSMPWWPRSTGVDQLILKSCLPIRCYVGLKERSDKKIVFEDIVMYASEERGFESIPASIIFKEIDRIFSPIQDFLSEKWIRKGYSISILSEVWKGHSLGFTGTMTTVLTTAFSLIVGEIDQALLHDHERFMSSQEKEAIFRRAWQWELILRKGRTLWQTIMHTLYGISTPALYTLETPSETFSPEQVADIPAHLAWFEDFDPACKGSFEIPFEYALVFTGTLSETFKIEHFKEADIRNTNALSEFIQENVFSHIPTKNLYYKNLLDQFSPYAHLTDSIGILNLGTIRLFYELFRSGYNNALVEGFIEHVNHLRELLSIIEPQTHFATEFLRTFQQTKKNPEEMVGILPTYSWKLGWGYLVILKHGMSRETLMHTCDEMKEYYPKMNIDYFSAIDGENVSGIQVEQDVQAEQFSVFMPKGQVRYIDNTGTSHMWDYNDILNEPREGILFDSIARKIYFNNERLTSADVPSQTTLTDIINILIDRIGEDVENTTFPLSSYMKSKNEMLGKIVIPLVRFLEKKTGKELPLVCKWELGSFYLKLGQTDLKIGVIRKV